MKKYTFSFLSVACALLAVSCSNDKDLYSPEEVNTTIENFLTTKDVTVTVPSGKVAVVHMGLDTLAVSDETTEVVEPKGITPTVDFYDVATSSPTSRGVDQANSLAAGNNQQLWQVIAFEDSKTGDKDYNDLIIHPKYILDKKAKTLFIGVHPVALGATKSFGLGCEVYVNGTLVQEYSIDNVRKDLFLDADGTDYINTRSYNRHYDGYTWGQTLTGITVSSLANISVAWYITVDRGEKIYALNKTKIKEVDMIDSSGYPYALVLTGVSVNGHLQGKIKCGYDWFRYPMEGVSIDKCYNLTKWAQTGNGTCLESYIIDGAEVFDVDEYHFDASNGRIYTVSVPYHLVTTWE
jgi:hypothetical protein